MSLVRRARDAGFGPLAKRSAAPEDPDVVTVADVPRHEPELPEVSVLDLDVIAAGVHGDRDTWYRISFVCEHLVTRLIPGSIGVKP
jgi:hypothetical protein